MSNRGLMDALGRILGDTLRTGLRTWLRDTQKPAGRSPRPRSTSPGAPRRPSGAPAASGYPGDFRGMPEVAYVPVPGKRPDPGEIVWTWVPYEEDHSRGKDRPVLLVGRDGAWLLALQMTSVDHDRDARQEAREGRYWVDIGTGAWDPQGRASEVRVNRVIRVDPDAVRRVSVSVSRATFEVVVAEMRRRLP
ncbi:type II toxin-antitoxin system PemK/MazF family toxin [Propioniciclava coleopterorum]|nr:type II toxin-antitoxin system PemK/MazF family toxin [Propioniciclava coleopterorum]